VADAEVDPEVALDRRVNDIIEEWARREGARGALSNAEMHARRVVNAARDAVRELLVRQDAEQKAAVDAAVAEVREELEGLNEALTLANTDLLADVERKGELLERLGMSHQVASQVAVKLGQSITRVVLIPGGGTVGAGMVSYDIGDDVVVVYTVGFEPYVEISNRVRSSVVSYLIGEEGLEQPQLSAIGTLFGIRVPAADNLDAAPEEGARHTTPCFEG
jgi:hypothetical protein